MQASPDRQYLGVRGRIVGLGHLVGTLGEDVAVPDDHRRERATAFCDVLAGQVDRALGEVRHTSEGSPAAISDKRCGSN
jgi:hypothetical protein